MPESKKRKKHGRPVAPPPRPKPERAVWHDAGRWDAPEPAPVAFADPVGHPVWLVGRSVNWRPSDLYRAVWPARVAGGEVRRSLVVRPPGGRGAAPVLIGDAFGGDPRRLAAALARPGAAVVGLSRVLTVIRATTGPEAEPLIGLAAAAHGAGLPVWSEWDDDLTAYDWTRAMREAVRDDPVARRLMADPRTASLAEESLADYAEEKRAAVGACAAAWLRACAGAVVATERLAAVVGELAPRLPVRVIRNAVDAAAVPSRAAERRREGPPRVGLAGTDEKLGDWKPILPAVLGLARAGAIELHFFGVAPHMAEAGWRPSTEVGTRRAGRYTVDGAPYAYHGGMPDLLAYQRAIGLLDVALAPLRDTGFNRARSASKWMEHGLHATATIVQDLDPFAWLADGGVCLKAGTPDEWGAQLVRLVEDADLRRRIGGAARDLVLAEHTLEARAPEWRALVAEAAGMARGDAPAEAA